MAIQPVNIGRNVFQATRGAKHKKLESLDLKALREEYAGLPPKWHSLVMSKVNDYQKAIDGGLDANSREANRLRADITHMTGTMKAEWDRYNEFKKQVRDNPDSYDYNSQIEGTDRATMLTGGEALDVIDADLSTVPEEMGDISTYLTDISDKMRGFAPSQEIDYAKLDKDAEDLFLNNADIQTIMENVGRDGFVGAREKKTLNVARENLINQFKYDHSGELMYMYQKANQKALRGGNSKGINMSFDEYATKEAEARINKKMESVKIYTEDTDLDKELKEDQINALKLKNKGLRDQFKKKSLAGEYTYNTGNDAVMEAIVQLGLEDEFLNERGEIRSFSEEELADMSEEERDKHTDRLSNIGRIAKELVGSRYTIPLATPGEATLDGSQIQIGMMSGDGKGGYNVVYVEPTKTTEQKGKADDRTITKFDFTRSEVATVDEAWIRNYARKNDLDEEELLYTLGKGRGQNPEEEETDKAQEVEGGQVVTEDEFFND
jgi:hypothetical protein